ncbi:CC_3452 family protein [uncultured Sphingomonas sp.]|uniref:CC_3452 family protein n=1 Tax=uncultured Sphingomonas sp. TaxID=158754 RepID=UPI003749149A
MKTVAAITAALVALTSAAPALAQANYYTATPKAEFAKSSVVTRSTMWKCTGGTCTAPRTGERDAVLCELVVQRVGALASFSAGGTAFGEDALAKCNARAR